MTNPKYFSNENEPTFELLEKLSKAKKTYIENLDNFCEKEFVEKDDLKVLEKVYLIGSQASDDWNENSDVDIKIVNFVAIPENLFRYKRKVLDPLLCSAERKSDWIDLFFVGDDYKVMEPRIDLTDVWNQINTQI
jgi:predicted nucleotidyltransferase